MDGFIFAEKTGKEVRINIHVGLQRQLIIRLMIIFMILDVVESQWSAQRPD
jgi:hypothetical protein